MKPRLSCLALLAGQSVYIHFDGADYRAVVTVNDTFVGEHEGFFSPFEFEITGIVKDGTNRLKVELYNDHIYMGNDPGGSEETEGDKLYAATGLGWDGPLDGWHHCPSGTGIYNRVYVEIRNPSISATSISVRWTGRQKHGWKFRTTDMIPPGRAFAFTLRAELPRDGL